MNLSRRFFSLIIVITILLLAACGEESTQSTVTAPSPVPAPKQGKSVPSKVQSDNEISPPPPPYGYSAEGRRDPFKIPLIAPKRSVEETNVPLTPLQMVDLGQLRLIAILVGKGEPRAMVVAPGGKSYILKKGVKIGKNDGFVKNITADEVIVEENYVDFSGETITNLLSISLSKGAGAK